MAKRKNTKHNIKQTEENIVSLPQNILIMGEHVEENKSIYISQQAYKAIHSFTKDKTVNESGGILVGDVIDELGKTNILISDFIEAKYCEGTPTTLTFTHESWEYIHKEMAKHPKKKIIGWIHTHPNFGIFLSEYDKFIQENFFKEDYEVAYVVDPIQNIEGFYFWINGRIERCKGFFIYDKTGKEISISTIEERKDEAKKKNVSPLFQYLTIVLSIAVILLFFAFAKTSSDIKTLNKSIANLQSQQKNIVESANNSFVGVGIEIERLAKRVSQIETTESVNEEDITSIIENMNSISSIINEWILQKTEDETKDNGDSEIDEDIINAEEDKNSISGAKDDKNTSLMK